MQTQDLKTKLSEMKKLIDQQRSMQNEIMQFDVGGHEGQL